MNIEYTVDSSAWLEYFLGENEELKNIIETKEIGTSYLVIAELSDKFARNSKSFDVHFLYIKTRSKLLSLPLQSCIDAGILKKNQRATKPKFGIMDSMIYLLSRYYNAKLITFDQDFSGFENVIIF
ncbi:MAG: PIN domain-containing protein [Nanoarchaeota archaeon]|nr:PIN domain-containing protein [Nanoarchaeota archaeon]